MIYAIHHTVFGSSMHSLLGQWEADSATDALDMEAVDRGWASWAEWCAHGGPRDEVIVVDEHGAETRA